MQTLALDRESLAAWLREQPTDRIYKVDNAEGCPLACYLDAVVPADAPHSVFYGVVQTKDEDDGGDAKIGRCLPQWAIQFYAIWDIGDNEGANTERALALLTELEAHPLAPVIMAKIAREA